MLQQTQVSTVIPYYERFLQRFPTLTDLAAASLEEVMPWWSGLGYYRRARHLHACARAVVERFGGIFPADQQALISLPGIGRSTAAAISAFAYGQRAAILDGNVKRVLTRAFGVEGWPGHPAIEKQLWALAESLLPADNIEAYTQGLMDLGATVCTRTRPQCGQCPWQTRCVAYLSHRISALPTPKPKTSPPRRRVAHMLLVLHEAHIWLEKRPPSGIWGGLWSVPEFDHLADLHAYVEQHYPTSVLTTWAPREHAFTHYTLDFTPHVCVLSARPLARASQTEHTWLSLYDSASAALPAPIKKLLAECQLNKD